MDQLLAIHDQFLFGEYIPTSLTRRGETAVPAGRRISNTDFYFMSK
ncbi:hypothetical protein [Cupriavidus pinatubonensis]|nr:hypothetical protein [Cupriavidus pinatubonensis]